MDDGRLPGEMTLEDIARRLDRIEGKIETIEVKFDEKFAGVDRRFDAVDEKLAAVDQRFDAVDEKLAAVDQRFDAVNGKFTAVDKRLNTAQARDAAIETAMKDGFRDVREGLNAAKIRDEQIHGLLKFSLEAREGLRESMDDRFDAMDKKHDEEIALLNTVIGRSHHRHQSRASVTSASRQVITE